MLSVRCEICDIGVNTHEQLLLHEQGKQHLKRLQQHQLKANFVSKAPSSNVPEASSFWCHLCNIQCLSAAMLEVHKSGPGHQERVRGGGETAYAAFRPPLAPMVPTSVRCEVCNIDCNNFEQLQLHERGGQHQKKLRQRQGGHALRGSSGDCSYAKQEIVNGVMQLRCTLCNIPCNTMEQMRIHESGEKHLKKMRAAGELPTAKPSFNPTVGSLLRSNDGYMCAKCSQSFPGPTEMRNHRCYGKAEENQAPVSFFQASLDAGIVELTSDVNDIRCRLCGLSCNTREAMETHLSGGKHQRKTKLLPPGTLPPSLTAVTAGTVLTNEMQDLELGEGNERVLGSDGMVECRVCKLKMNPNNADSHFAGKQHRQKLMKMGRAPQLPTSRPSLLRHQQVRHETAVSWTKTKPRHYQLELFNEAMLEDCVVYLPTGTGKTLVAAMVIAQMLDSNPHHQVVFVVEKALLVLQQAEYLREELQTAVKRFNTQESIQCERVPRIASVSGDLTDIGEENRFPWQQDVIVTTVDFCLNLLRKAALRWEDLCLVVFDEAHHCVKEHPFNRLLRDYSLPKPASLRPKVLGLTASPAGSLTEQETYQDVVQLLQNMGNIRIAAVERCKEELDTYASCCEISIFQDVADATEQDLLKHLIHTAAEIFCIVLPPQYTKFADGLKQDIRGPSPDWESVSKLTGRLVEYARAANPNAAALAVSCLQSFYALQAGGWELANPEVTSLQRQLRTVPSTLSQLQPVLKLLHAAVNTAAVSHASTVNVACVMSKLVDLVIAGLRQTPQVATNKAVVLVLTSQRSVASTVSDYLDSHIAEKLDCQEDVKVTHIVGHGSTSGHTVREKLGERKGLTKGMTVGQQQKLLKKIRDLEFKVIVATSVAEEGVDLPSCGLVILLAPPNTMTALVQMRGRARLRESKFVILCRDPKQKNKLEGLIARELNMQKAVRRVRDEQSRRR